MKTRSWLLVVLFTIMVTSTAVQLYMKIGTVVSKIVDSGDVVGVIITMLICAAIGLLVGIDIDIKDEEES